MSPCALVSWPTKRSIAHPPAIHQGTLSPERTCTTSSGRTADHFSGGACCDSRAVGDSGMRAFLTEQVARGRPHVVARRLGPLRERHAADHRDRATIELTHDELRGGGDLVRDRDLGHSELVPVRVELPDVSLQDRKSTRLNSSHVAISYAVFCLKKKKK